MSLENLAQSTIPYQFISSLEVIVICFIKNLDFLRVYYYESMKLKLKLLLGFCKGEQQRFKTISLLIKMYSMYHQDLVRLLRSELVNGK